MALPWAHLLTAIATPAPLYPLGWSWDTLPVHWFSGNVTSQLSDAAAEQIASRHSLAIINGQGHAYFAGALGAHAEEKMAEAGQLLKAASARLGRPEISVLSYFNSMLDWTAYDFHAWLEEKPSRYLHDVHGNCIVGRRDNLNNTLRIPDFSQRAVSDQWVSNIVSATSALDGVFVDQGKWCSPFVCKARPGVYAPGQLEAWATGHWAALHALRAAMPRKIVIINNWNTTAFPVGFDHEYENFNATSAQFRALQYDASLKRLATCHTQAATYNSTLPLFLLGAGDYAYFAATFLRGASGAPGDPEWMEPSWDGRRDDYSRALGAPTGPAVIATNNIASRTFASGTVVKMNISDVDLLPYYKREGGCVYWADGNKTGKASVCHALEAL